MDIAQKVPGAIGILSYAFSLQRNPRGQLRKHRGASLPEVLLIPQCIDRQLLKELA